MPVQPAALELLTALSKVLGRWGRWYVFGAQAVIAYGVPRLSGDVDITLQLVPDEPASFVRDMEAAGFALRVDDPDFVRRYEAWRWEHEGPIHREFLDLFFPEAARPSVPFLA